jgi:hypothetical protein
MEHWWESQKKRDYYDDVDADGRTDSSLFPHIRYSLSDFVF